MDSIGYYFTNPNNTINDGGSEVPWNSEISYLFLDIKSVNDPPQSSNIADQTVIEGGILNIPLNLSLIDVDGDVTYSITSTMVGGEFNDSHTSDVLTLDFSNASNYNGTFGVSITYAETSEEGLQVTDVFNVTVTEDNDAPFMYPISNKQILQGENFTVSTFAYDIDGDTDFEFTPFTSEMDLNLSISGNTLGIAPESTLIGDYDIFVSATDGTDFSQAVSFRVSIEDVSEPPIIPAIASLSSINEDEDIFSFDFTPKNTSRLKWLQRFLCLVGLVLIGFCFHRTNVVIHFSC